jgi:hypothetical protein
VSNNPGGNDRAIRRAPQGRLKAERERHKTEKPQRAAKRGDEPIEPDDDSEEVDDRAAGPDLQGTSEAHEP